MRLASRAARNRRSSRCCAAQGSWRDLDQVELGTAQWVAWFNTERTHEHLDDLSGRCQAV